MDIVINDKIRQFKDISVAMLCTLNALPFFLTWKFYVVAIIIMIMLHIALYHYYLNKLEMIHKLDIWFDEDNKRNDFFSIHTKLLHVSITIDCLFFCCFFHLITINYVGTENDLQAKLWFVMLYLTQMFLLLYEYKLKDKLIKIFK